MITVNLIRPPLVSNLALAPASRLSSAGLPPSLHSRLMERLLGKCPLQLVVERAKVEKGVWKEKLSCGHEVLTFQEFLWDANDSLVEVEITAKRRRCRKCKPAVAPILKSRAELTADQARAALVHERKLKFGSLFEKLCFPNGEMRPGELSDPASLPQSSPRKPVESVGRIEKEETA